MRRRNGERKGWGVVNCPNGENIDGKFDTTLMVTFGKVR